MELFRSLSLPPAALRSIVSNAREAKIPEGLSMFLPSPRWQERGRGEEAVSLFSNSASWRPSNTAHDHPEILDCVHRDESSCLSAPEARKEPSLGSNYPPPTRHPPAH